MKSPVLFIGVLLAGITCVTDAFSQSGEVTGGSITCHAPGYDVSWSGTWDRGGYDVVGVLEPDYWFGSVPVEIVKIANPGSGGTVTFEHLAQTYPYEGHNYSLVGAWVWFEFGNWVWSDLQEDYVWVGNQVSTSWYYFDFVPLCLAAGTPLLTPDGSKAIERFKAGDSILSSPENDPGAAVVASRVKEVIRSRAKLVEIVVGGHMVHASREHPFYVKDKSWTAAASLDVGDLLRSHDGRWLPVESIADGGERPVYNLRVETNSTYFVGGSDWGFSLWVYGDCSKGNTPPEAFVHSKPLPWHSLNDRSHSRR